MKWLWLIVILVLLALIGWLLARRRAESQADVGPGQFGSDTSRDSFTPSGENAARSVGTTQADADRYSAPDSGDDPYSGAATTGSSADNTWGEPAPDAETDPASRRNPEWGREGAPGWASQDPKTDSGSEAGGAEAWTDESRGDDETARVAEAERAKASPTDARGESDTAGTTDPGDPLTRDADLQGSTGNAVSAAGPEREKADDDARGADDPTTGPRDADPRDT